MSESLLEHLAKDTLPEPLLREFVQWCALEQAKPALVDLLTVTGFEETARQLATVDTLATLATVSEDAGEQAQEARKRTGPLGLSSAEAAANLTNRLVRAAMGDPFEPDAVAFFAAQVCGWKGFADGNFTDSQQKQTAEAAARVAQEAKLRALWLTYGGESTE